MHAIRKTSLVKTDTYFDSRLHNNRGGIVDALCAQVEHCVVTLVFCFGYVLIDLLKKKKT